MQLSAWLDPNSIGDDHVPCPTGSAASRSSPFYDAEVLERGVGILFNGKERTDVSEYCVSEGWIRVPAGKAKDRFGQPMTIKLKGTVEPFESEQPTAS